MPKLGLVNILYVAWYRFTIKCGLRRRMFPAGKTYNGRFILIPPSSDPIDIPETYTQSLKREAEEINNGILHYFARHDFKIGSPPDWFVNPFNGSRVPEPQKHWTLLKDFDPAVGDIKTIWEASRFGWTHKLARCYRLTGDRKHLELLNGWVSDWVDKNPLNTGPNWKCGQEASIRMINLLLSAYVIGDVMNPSSSLVRFVSEHCERIETNIRYALSLDNNHGTSEAAALLIGGAWLGRVAAQEGAPMSNAKKWEEKGRYWLERLVIRQVSRDGGFSQHSVNYHRVLVDTLSIVVFWQRHLGLARFSEQFYERARAAVNWFFQMVDPQTGEAPNLGANDGSLFFPLSSCDYRDFRPGVQLGAVLFYGSRAYPEGPWDEPLYWLSLDSEKGRRNTLIRDSTAFTESGYVTFLAPASWGIVHAPNYRFRPSHADAMHLDIWNKGVNVIRDTGSYSYNCEPPWDRYFQSAAAHNTIQFDSHDQMPRIGRFLFAKWTRAKTERPLQRKNGVLSWEGSYTDYYGCRHNRRIVVEKNCWKVTDTISGYKEKAVLRWFLIPGKWSIENNKCKGPNVSIEIAARNAKAEIALREGWESRYYFEKTNLPLLEITVSGKNAVLTTTVNLKL